MGTRSRWAAGVASVALLVSACASEADLRPETTAPTFPAGSVEAARAAATRAADGQQGGTVKLMGLLAGAQQEKYLATLAPLQDATGITIEYETAGDLQAILRTRIAGGNPPDMVSNPSAGQIRDLAVAGDLVSIDGWVAQQVLEDGYDESLRELGTVDGKLYGLLANTALQGLVWHDPRTYQGPTAEPWADLSAWTEQRRGQGTTPWCIGIESGPASGWPGAVWIEQFMLHNGGDTYDRWWQGDLAWTSPEVRAAFESFGAIAADPELVNGGPKAVLTTNFAESPKGLFAKPPVCDLHLQADWLGGAMVQANPDVEPITGVDFFPFPARDAGADQPLEITGETLGAFRDLPQVRTLMRYVASPEYSALVAKTGSWLGPNVQTPTSAYPSELSKKIAEFYANADDVRFGAKDAMPSAMSQAFLAAVVDYVESPENLDRILVGLEAKRAEAY